MELVIGFADQWTRAVFLLTLRVCPEARPDPLFRHGRSLTIAVQKRTSAIKERVSNTAIYCLFN
jgi:hypothetical protein